MPYTIALCCIVVICRPSGFLIPIAAVVICVTAAPDGRGWVGLPFQPCLQTGRQGSLWHIPFFTFSPLACTRYAIDRSTDTERIFDIDANTGAIVTGKVLDRETAGWHNITVLAMEAGEQRSSRLGWTRVWWSFPMAIFPMAVPPQGLRSQ